LVQKIKQSIKWYFLILLFCVPLGVGAKEVLLDCRPDFEVIYGVEGYLSGVKQENDWDPVSVAIDMDASRLSYQDIENVFFEKSGNHISFELTAHEGALLYKYKIDVVTKILEVGMWGKPGNHTVFYPKKDENGRTLAQKNIFNCTRSVPLI
jgi:hypothetical protein